MKTYVEREQQFIKELTALTKKHKVSIGGCGCCGSPYLDDADGACQPEAGYVYVKELRWVHPAFPYDWEKYADKIIK